MMMRRADEAPMMHHRIPRAGPQRLQRPGSWAPSFDTFILAFGTIGSHEQLLDREQRVQDRHLEDDLPVLLPVPAHDTKHSKAIILKWFRILAIQALEHLQDSRPDFRR